MEGERRRKPVPIVFMIAWLVFWLAGIFVALRMMGGAVLEGEPVAALVLALWLGAAGLGLYHGMQRLFGLLLGERRGGGPRPPHPRHDWRDDMPRGPER
jgi:hypothetical protein